MSEESLAPTSFPSESLSVTSAPSVFTTFAVNVSPFFMEASCEYPSPEIWAEGISVVVFMLFTKISPIPAISYIFLQTFIPSDI